MTVLVTGGTGLVGSHVAVALVAAGHDVRLLVRRPEQVATTFRPHGITPTEVMVGDVLDAASVDAALQGCRAVVHAAAVYSLLPGDAGRVAGTNVAATRNVLGAAVRAGLDPVVHVSSSVALTRRGGSGPDLPLGDLEGVYARSKTESEAVAREFQASGHPVVTVYPGGVLGPHDPYLGDQANRLAWVARGLMPVWPRGGMLYVDVRDVAATVVACLEPGRGPRRYVVPGTHVDGPTYYAAVSAALGRARPHVDLPAGIASALSRSTEPLNAFGRGRWHYPADAEGVEIASRDTRLDDTPARTELGVAPRAFDATVRDTLDWLVDAGHLPSRLRPKPAAGA